MPLPVLAQVTAERWNRFAANNPKDALQLKAIIFSACQSLRSKQTTKQIHTLMIPTEHQTLMDLLRKHGEALNVDPKRDTSILTWITTLCLYFTLEDL